MWRLGPLSFVYPSPGFDWLVKLGSSTNLYMTGYITVSMGSQAHAPNEKSAKCTRIKEKRLATFGHVFGMELMSCAVQTQRGNVCVFKSLSVLHTHPHCYTTTEGGIWGRSTYCISSNAKVNSSVQGNYLG